MISRRAWFTVLAVTLSSAASVLALEAVVRTAFSKEVDSAVLRARPQPASVVPFVRRLPHPELLYDLKPGFRAVGWNGARVETAASGCCRVVPGRPADDGPGLRVAIIGDSTPFAWKLPFEDGYGERLRPLLQRTRGPVAIRNFAVPGYNSQQNRVVLREKVLPWRPGLIILHYDHNDSEPVDDARTGFMAPEYGDNALHSMLIKLVLRRRRASASVRRTIVVPGDPAHPERLLHDYRYEGPQFEQHMREMKTIAQLAAAEKIPVMVLIWNPWLTRHADPESDHFYTFLHKPVAARLRSLGFRVADTYAPYQEFMRREGRKDLRSLWADADDAHPNAAGHSLIAGFLANEIGLRPIP